MLITICDIIIVLFGIPLVVSMYKWKRRIIVEIEMSRVITDEIKQKLTTCRQTTIITAILIVLACIDLAVRVARL